MKTIPAICLLAALLPTAPALARGGGGCLEEGTPIETPAGAVAIERLKMGDTVWSVQAGGLRPATVRAVFRVQPDEYVELQVDGATIHLTGEHPVQTAPGVFRSAATLRPGDSVLGWRQGRAEPLPVAAARRILSPRPAFNLLVSPGGTYLAGGIVVHNKGCFLPDTPILLADGNSVAISAVRPGDAVLAFTPDGNVTSAVVRDILRVEVEQFAEVATGTRILRVTPDHPFYAGDGVFRTLESLKAGDRIWAFDGLRLSPQPIVAIRLVRARALVYNLQTDAPHTFFADGIAVHNKGGGCFPPGTVISTPTGALPIERLAPGDAVLGVTSDGRLVPVRVEAVYETAIALFTVRTDGGDLVTTAEHPVALADGGFRPAGDLLPGEEVLLCRTGRLQRAKVLSTCQEPGDRRVLNLQVDGPHTFVAGGFVVHNKGGGFGGGHSLGGGHSFSSGRSGTGSSGRSDDIMPFVVIGVILFVIAIIYILRHRSKREEDLDFCYTRAQISRKEGKTAKLLEFIAGTDPAFKPQILQAHAQEVFQKLQQCWEAREYAPMQPLLTEELYREHCAQIESLKRNHEINVIEGLQVEQVDLVNVRYTDKPDGREFTALITARARDYYVDDQSREFRRGDGVPARFQEFWTFELRGGRWLLREIEQTRESDALKEENFFEAFTDRNVAQVYGKEAGQEGPIGPWQESATATKADRIDRLLNFLVRTDKLWDRTAMVERARQVYLGVMLAREAGDPSAVKDEDLFPELAASLREQIAAWKARGLSQEYRNLCVRKVELVLVRNFSDNSRDEYTVRISAHAQQVTRKGGQVTYRDEFVSPITEFWTFGRLDNLWKLKEALPPGKGEALVREENLDEDSSPSQLNWYYRQTRAM
jgi:predicted lipid-binding transport protein (Tim44 family)